MMKVELCRKGDSEACRVRSRVCHALRWMVSFHAHIFVYLEVEGV